VAIASIPFMIALAVIAGYFSYERYREHKIMTSEAGQAIKNFLDIVNETQDEFPELTKPQAEPNKPDKNTILSPFDNIKSIDED
jgi:cytochrome b subunit of formate dehydrogenase